MSSAVTTTQRADNVQVLCDEISPFADNAEAAAARKTISTLIGHKLASDAGHPFTFAPTKANISPEVETFLKHLTITANAAAASVFCGSVLAGHTSEADDYGDVAFYLGPGDYGPGHEQGVLLALGLGNTQDVTSSDVASKTVSECQMDGVVKDILRLYQLSLRPHNRYSCLQSMESRLHSILPGTPHRGTR